MTRDHLGVFLFLVHLAFCFPRERTTEHPGVPLMANPKQRRPTHISEFTDPDTGLNPFLDLEEGRTSEGRNVMEDDQPYFDFDLVEGDAPDRTWKLEEEPVQRIPYRPPQLETKNSGDFHMETTTPDPHTTVGTFDDHDEGKAAPDELEKEHQVEREQRESWESTIIFATTAVAVMVVVVVLIGVWWRRKLKTTQSSTAENGEVKS